MQSIISYNNESSGGFRQAGEDRYAISPPTNYTRVFQNEVWNVFNALGMKHTAVPFPDSTSIGHRLIAPSGSELLNLRVMKSVID